MARKSLPNKTGTRYTEVVISCLSCLDKDNNFGREGELLGNGGILVGVHYIEKASAALATSVHLLTISDFDSIGKHRASTA
jgi:hypothetical protein